MEGFKHADPQKLSVLIIPRTLFQSTDISGIEQLYLMRYYPHGMLLQILGRAHRRCAQAKYEKPWVLNVCVVLYNPFNQSTRLACDYWLRLAMSTNEDAATTLMDIARDASFGCTALNALQEAGIKYLDANPSCADITDKEAASWRHIEEN